MKTVIDAAVQCLQNGELVILPTESVYGIAADPFNPQARQRWFAAKGRAQRQPFTIHLAEADEANDWVAAIPPVAAQLIAEFWPGPLTLILANAKTDLPHSSQDGSVGLRCVDHPLTRAVIRALGHGVMMSSANPTGQPAPVTADEARQQAFRGQVALVVEGGDCDEARASTILNLATGPRILREGPITRQQIEPVLQGHGIVLK